MKRYLLDTPLLAAYFYNRQTAVEIIQPWIADDEAATSILVYGDADSQAISPDSMRAAPKRKPHRPRHYGLYGPSTLRA